MLPQSCKFLAPEVWCCETFTFLPQHQPNANFSSSTMLPRKPKAVQLHFFVCALLASRSWRAKPLPAAFFCHYAHDSTWLRLSQLGIKFICFHISPTVFKNASTCPSPQSPYTISTLDTPWPNSLPSQEPTQNYHTHSPTSRIKWQSRPSKPLNKYWYSAAPTSNS